MSDRRQCLTYSISLKAASAALCSGCVVASLPGSCKSEACLRQARMPPFRSPYGAVCMPPGETSLPGNRGPSRAGRSVRWCSTWRSEHGACDWRLTCSSGFSRQVCFWHRPHMPRKKGALDFIVCLADASCTRRSLALAETHPFAPACGSLQDLQHIISTSIPGKACHRYT